MIVSMEGKGHLERSTIVPTGAKGAMVRSTTTCLGACAHIVRGTYYTTGMVAVALLERVPVEDKSYIIVDNIGEPFRGPDGKPLANVELTFSLANNHSLTDSAVDQFSGSIFVGEKKVRTNSRGEFSIELWPNDRGTHTDGYPTVYQVRTTPRILEPGFVFIRDSKPKSLKFSFLWTNRNKIYNFTKNNLVPLEFTVVGG